MVYLARPITWRSGVRIPPSQLILNTIDMESLNLVGQLARMLSKVTVYAEDLKAENEDLERQFRNQSDLLKNWEAQSQKLIAENNEFRARQAEAREGGTGMQELLAELEGIAEFYDGEMREMEMRLSLTPHTSNPEYVAKGHRLYELQQVIGTIKEKYLIMAD